MSLQVPPLFRLEGALGAVLASEGAVVPFHIHFVNLDLVLFNHLWRPRLEVAPRSTAVVPRRIADDVLLVCSNSDAVLLQVADLLRSKCAARDVAVMPNHVDIVLVRLVLAHSSPVLRY